MTRGKKLIGCIAAGIAACCSAAFLPTLAVAGEIEYRAFESGWDYVEYDSLSVNRDPNAHDRLTAVRRPTSTVFDAQGANLLPRAGPYFGSTVTNCAFVLDRATCRGEVDQVQIALRGGSDIVRVTGNVTSEVYGGAGQDILRGSDSTDRLYGDRDPGEAAAKPGADEFFGNAGVDEVSYWHHPGPVTVTLDDQPNDGAPGEGDNVHTDIEEVSGTFEGDDLLIGNAGSNHLAGIGEMRGLAGSDEVLGAGILDGGDGDDRVNATLGAADTLIGGAGQDEIDGWTGADDIFARDGEADDVDCGPGPDIAVVDEIDTVRDCEIAELP